MLLESGSRPGDSGGLDHLRTVRVRAQGPPRHRLDLGAHLAITPLRSAAEELELEQLRAAHFFGVGLADGAALVGGGAVWLPVTGGGAVGVGGAASIGGGAGRLPVTGVTEGVGSGAGRFPLTGC